MGAFLSFIIRVVGWEKKKTSQNLKTLIPEEILIQCIARVPKHRYPKLSAVSKQFRTMVASPELYAERSLLGCTESCIYVPIYDMHKMSVHWYTFHPTYQRLIPISSLPSMPYSSSLGRRYLVVGSRIFVLGVYYASRSTTNVSTIDCRYNMVQHLCTVLKMPVNPVVDVVDGKIYVIGGLYGKDSNVWSSNLMMVLDTKSQTWEFEQTNSGLEPGHNLLSSVVVEDKIYIKGCRKSFVIKEKEGKWVEEEKEEEEASYEWSTSGCVIEGILYSYDMIANCLRAYDLKKNVSRGVVKGVELLTNHRYKANVTSCGKGRLLLMHNGDINRPGIWCAQIALMEINQNGEIWGNVEWCKRMLRGDVCFLDCLTVIV